MLETQIVHSTNREADNNSTFRPYSESHPIWLNHAEKNFLKVLKKAVANRASIVTKVKLTDVMSRFTEPDLFLKADLQDITVDFVLCNKNDQSVCCLIELDDRPPAQQKKSDTPSSALTLICRQMGIPLIKIKAMCGYQLEQIKAKLEQYIS